MSDNKSNDNNWRQKEFGALWARKGRNQNYFSGYVTVGDLGFEKKVKIVGFKNNYKDNEKQPDFRLYVSEEKSNDIDSQSEPSASLISSTHEESSFAEVGEDQSLL